MIRNSQGNKEPGQTTLKVNDPSDIFKSKSLPRGMPSDFESMSSESSLLSFGVPKAITANSQEHNEMNDTKGDRCIEKQISGHCCAGM